MITIITFFLCIAIAIAITIAYLRFLAFMADRHPSWVGEGLRKRLIGLFRSNNKHRQDGKYPDTKIIPTDKSSYFKQGLNKEQEGIGEGIARLGCLQGLLHNIYSFYYRHHQNQRTNTEDGNGNPEDSISIQLHSATLSQRQKEINQNGTLPKNQEVIMSPINRSQIEKRR